MEPFEELLKQTLERKEPSDGFTERVLAQARKLDSRPRRRFFLPFWFAPALAVLLVLAATLGYQRHRERQEGERASEQLVVALRLTGMKLHQIRNKVAQIGTVKELER